MSPKTRMTNKLVKIKMTRTRSNKMAKELLRNKEVSQKSIKLTQKLLIENKEFLEKALDHAMKCDES